MKTTHIETKRTRRRRIIREFLKRVIIGSVLLALTLAFLAWFVPFVLDKADQEAAWREARLCKNYEVCDPKAGP